MPDLNRDHDYTSENGAHALAGAIRRFWRNKDKFPIVTVHRTVNAASATAAERELFVVRSNMVGGQPV